MGKSTKPLKLAVPKELMECPEVKELVDKGHDIVVIESDRLYLGACCWRIPKGQERMIPLALKQWRKVTYAKEE